VKSKTIFKKIGNNLVVSLWTEIVKKTARKVGEKDQEKEMYLAELEVGSTSCWIR
jgi:hypothetical protein